MSFKDISDGDIDIAETFIRCELLDLFREKCRNQNVEFNDADKVHFFGIFESNPTNFRFLPGDKKLIKALAVYVTQFLAEDNDEISFDMPIHYKVSKKDTHLFAFGLFFGKRSKPARPNISSMVSIEPAAPKPENHKEAVCQKVNEAVKKCGLMQFFTEDSIRIVNTGNSIRANVKCHFCTEMKIDKVIFVQGEQRNGSSALYWNKGNFMKHLLKKHASNEQSDEKQQQQQQAKDHSSRKSSVDPSDKGISFNEFGINDQLVHLLSVPDANNQISAATNNNTDDANVQQVDLTEHVPVINTSLDSAKDEQMVYEYVDVIVENDVNEDEEKHFDEVYRQISAQNLKLVESSLVNGEEVDSMIFALSPGIMKSLRLMKIEADGNCLFGSLAHQIFGHKTNSRNHRQATKDLRRQVSERIKANLEEYKRFLAGSVANSNDDQEMVNFVTEVLPESGKWAGSESIKAVSDIHKVNVIVFLENDLFYFHHSFNPTFERTVAIAYRTYGYVITNAPKNHYDSIVEIDSKDVFHCVQKLIVGSDSKTSTETQANSSVVIID